MEIWILVAIVGFAGLMYAISQVLSRQSVARLRAIGEKLGENVTVSTGFFSAPVLEFYRDGARFTALTKTWKYATEFVATFDKAPRDFRFQIKGSPDLGPLGRSEDIRGLTENTSSPLSPKYLLLSDKPERFEHLVAEPSILQEMDRYNTQGGQYVDIISSEGLLRVTYHSDGRNAEERLQTVCETAIEFHRQLAESK